MQSIKHASLVSPTAADVGPNEREDAIVKDGHFEVNRISIYTISAVEYGGVEESAKET